MLLTGPYTKLAIIVSPTASCYAVLDNEARATERSDRDLSPAGCLAFPNILNQGCPALSKHPRDKCLPQRACWSNASQVDIFQGFRDAKQHGTVCKGFGNRHDSRHVAIWTPAHSTRTC